MAAHAGSHPSADERDPRSTRVGEHPPSWVPCGHDRSGNRAGGHPTASGRQKTATRKMPTTTGVLAKPAPYARARDTVAGEAVAGGVSVSFMDRLIST
jgi:hypothetical protein